MTSPATCSASEMSPIDQAIRRRVESLNGATAPSILRLPPPAGKVPSPLSLDHSKERPPGRRGSARALRPCQNGFQLFCAGGPVLRTTKLERRERRRRERCP